MKKVIYTKGLPAAGKTTWSLKMCREQGYKRIGKDNLREMIDDDVYNDKNEELINSCRNALLLIFLKGGYNVVVDETNLNPKHAQEIAELIDLVNSFEVDPNNHYVLEEKFFDVDVNECIKRDSLRHKQVGAKAIRDMYNRHLKPSTTNTN